MSLATGARLGPYEILAAIGAGGMGEVYRARDTRLDRIVAIKVLAPEIAGDADSRERFAREAKTISALDHPHICALYDLGRAAPEPARPEPVEGRAEVDFLVMQYLEGETLADRLARRPLLMDETFEAATQIAGALDAAHRAGIVHRDLKPGNVMLTKSGVKLLDFGLAKIAAPVNPVAGVTLAATRSAPLTQQGSLLGTLQYMAPEQLEGKEADARSDIFAFGAILYEMLTGVRAFDAGSQAGIIAAILTSQPRAVADLATIRDTVPPIAARVLDRLVNKCLAKKPDARWQSTTDLGDELKWIDEERRRPAPRETDTTSDVGASLRSRTRSTWWPALTAALGAVAIGAAVVATWALTQPAPVGEPIRFTIQPPEHELFPVGPAFMAMSPDGKKLAFVAGPSSEKRRLWIRALDSVAAQPLTGTEGAWGPVWSPDSRYVAFTIGDNALGPLKKIDTRGGEPVTLASAGFPGAWSPSGIILFSGEAGARVSTDVGRVYRIDANGGRVVPATTLDSARQDVRHSPAFFLADGRHFVFHVLTADSSRGGAYLGSIDSTETRPIVLDMPTKPVYANGYLLYVTQESTLVAQLFDHRSGTLTGDTVPVAENVDFNVRNRRSAVGVSTNGVLAYRTGASQTSGTLAWFDATGRRVGSIPFEGWFSLSRPQLSPDGRQLIVTRQERQNVGRDLWLIDLDRGIPTRLTSDPADDDYPTWSPDGAYIVFRSNRNARAGNLYRRSAHGGGSDELLYQSAEDKRPWAISPDGSTLLFSRDTAETRADIWATAPARGATPKPAVVTPFSEGYASFSPDGKWFAYCADDAPPDQVYVEPFPPNGSTRIRLSTTGGSAPVWSRDGKHVFYSTPDNHLMAVDVAVDGNTVRASVPRELFVAQWTMFTHNGFGVDATGTRFLLPVPKDEQTAPPITVMVNWTASLPKR